MRFSHLSASCCAVWLPLLLVCVANQPFALGFDAHTYDPSQPDAEHEQAGRFFEQAGDIDKSIEAFQSAARFTNEAAQWVLLARAQASFKRAGHRVDALMEARDSAERALWLDRNNDDALDLHDQIQNELRRRQWSGGPDRKEWLAQALKRSARRSDASPPAVVEVESRDGFFEFLASSDFKTRYFEKEPVLIRGPKNMFGDDVYSTDQMLSGFYKMGNGGYVPPYRNMNFLKGSLARKPEVEGLPTWWAMRSGLMDGLRRGYNLQMLHAEHWEPSLARFVTQIQNYTKTISSTNVYVTPPGRELSTPPHTDFTCNLMVQIAGRKRWKLWKKPNIWNPANKKYIVGRDEFELLEDSDLGNPYMDVTIGRGDVLYVPRGCFHKTATPAPEPSAEDGSNEDNSGGDGAGAESSNYSDEVIVRDTSVHLTTHMARLHDFGGLEQVMPTVLGANDNILFTTRWDDSIDALLTVDERFRRGADYTVRGWRKRWRRMMHMVVDRMLDETDYFDAVERQFEMSRHRRLQQLYTKHGWTFTSERDLPAPNLLPDYGVDPVFMPSEQEVAAWNYMKRARATKCGAATNVMMRLRHFPSLYAPGSHTATNGNNEAAKNPRGLQLLCVHESEAGQCRQLAATRAHAAESAVEVDGAGGSEPRSPDHPRQAIIMLQYKRGHLFERVLGDIANQTISSDVYIWNNNVSPKFRCKLMRFASRIAKASKGRIRTLWMHNSPVNIGPPGSYVMAEALSRTYDRFIFIDDDCASPSSLVETFVKESIQFPKDMISTWGESTSLFALHQLCSPLTNANCNLCSPVVPPPCAASSRPCSLIPPCEQR